MVTDDPELSYRFARFLAAPRNWKRWVRAGSLEARPPGIWGRTNGPFALWCITSVILSPLLLPLIAFLFNRRGRALPGGGPLALGVPLLVVAAWASAAVLIRKRELKRRQLVHVGDDVAEHEGLPKRFADAVRRSVALAYRVPPDLISLRDTKRESRRFHLWADPLAIEVIADVCDAYGIAPDIRVIDVAEKFRSTRPKDILELSRTLYETMRDSKLLED